MAQLQPQRCQQGWFAYPKPKVSCKPEATNERSLFVLDRSVGCRSLREPTGPLRTRRTNTNKTSKRSEPRDGLASSERQIETLQSSEHSNITHPHGLSFVSFKLEPKKHPPPHYSSYSSVSLLIIDTLHIHPGWARGGQPGCCAGML